MNFRLNYSVPQHLFKFDLDEDSESEEEDLVDTEEDEQEEQCQPCGGQDDYSPCKGAPRKLHHVDQELTHTRLSVPWLDTTV